MLVEALLKVFGTYTNLYYICCMKTSRVYTKKLLEEAVTNSLSYSDVCRYVNKTPKGATYELIRNRIIDYGLDTSHFLGKAAYAGKRNPNYEKRTKKEDILVDNYKYRQNHKILKRGLLESNVEYKCNKCKISEWNGSALTLDIDHIDGNWKNCTLENLRFLCPNCHRQTNTFGGKNIRRNS